MLIICTVALNPLLKCSNFYRPPDFQRLPHGGLFFLSFFSPQISRPASEREGRQFDAGQVCDKVQGDSTSVHFLSCVFQRSLSNLYGLIKIHRMELKDTFTRVIGNTTSLQTLNSHSDLSAFTGFDLADLNTFVPIVAHAIRNIAAHDDTKCHQCNSVLKANALSHSSAPK